MKKFVLIILLFASFCGSLQAMYWEKIKTLPAGYANNYWLDIYFHPSNINYGWACGFGGQVVRTTDGGATWSGSTISWADHLESVHFPTLQIGYTSGVEGIFKSTDGGITWQDITPDPLQTYWGCYFLTAEMGMVIGGGCANGIQRFYRTTNGGSTWTISLGYEPNSGLTDLLLYADGSGYASSSGRIWKTTDNGINWNIHSVTGSNVWQEEMTKLGNSFLIPTAGANCFGAGQVGGMRFSTNYGASWNNFVTRNAMFGTFLLSTTSGWSCGYDRQVYYTNNAGISWQEFNCGIDEGSLDDIWFNSPNNGWVCGGEGIWRLVPASGRVSPEVLDFGDVCQPVVRTDTVWIRNLSFYSAVASINLLVNSTDFQIISPHSIEEIISPCDSLPVIIRFNPQSLGEKNAVLRVDINSKSIFVSISAKSVVPTVAPADNQVVINNAACGFTAYGNLQWNSTEYDEIVSFTRLSGSDLINPPQYLPIVTYIGHSANTVFSVVTLDTGWIETRFSVISEPCFMEHIINVRAYGVSPIIEAQRIIDINLECLSDSLIKIPIHNTGNIDLFIASIDIQSASPDFEYEGFSSSGNYPIVIKPQDSDTLLIRYNSEQAGESSAIIVIENNDSTKTRGDKNPFIIELNVRSSLPILIADISEIDFGRICLNDTVSRSFNLSNLGNMPANVNYRLAVGEYFQIKNVSDISIEPSSGILSEIICYAGESGDLLDTLFIEYQPCDGELFIVLKAFVVDETIILAPEQINMLIQANLPTSTTITLQSLANTDVTLQSFIISPIIENISVSIAPLLPITINSLESIEFTLEFLADNEGIYDFEICFEIDGQCPQVLCLPVNIAAKNRWIYADKDNINFGLMKCEPTEAVDVITIFNQAINNDTIVNISIQQSDVAFAINNLPEMPFYLPEDEPLSIEISFYPQVEGLFEAELIVETKQPDGQTIIIPISAEYKTVKTSANKHNIEFGKAEYCEPSRFDTVYVTNTGLLADTLYINNAYNSGFVISSEDTMIIASGVTEMIIIEAIVENLSIGKHNYTFNLTSLVCGEIITINAEIEIFKPLLDISPNPLDFDDVWSGDEKTLQIRIENTHNTAIYFDIIGIEPAVSGFSVDFAATTIMPQGIIQLPVRFSSVIEGLHTAELIVNQKSECYDTLAINLIANVPEEHYYPHFIIGDYQAVPGDTITMYIELDTAIVKVVPWAADFKIQLDRNLFEPLGLETLYPPQSSIPFTFRANSLSFSLSEEQAKGLLFEQGARIGISGVALFGRPDSTDVTFKSVYISASKRTTSIYEHGSLKTLGYCLPVADLRFLIMPIMEIREVFVHHDFIKINVYNTRQQSVEFELFDISGRKAWARTIEIGPNENDILLSTNNQNAGIYYLLVKSSGNQSFMEKIIIVR